MAKPPLLRVLNLTALGDVPPWGRLLVEQLSTFVQQVTDALSGNLTTENAAETFRDIDVVGGQDVAPVAYSLRGGRKVRGVFVAQAVGLGGDADPEAAVSIAWRHVSVSGGTGIQLTGVSGVSTGKRARITLLLKAE